MIAFSPTTNIPLSHDRWTCLLLSDYKGVLRKQAKEQRFHTLDILYSIQVVLPSFMLPIYAYIPALDKNSRKTYYNTV